MAMTDRRAGVYQAANALLNQEDTMWSEGREAARRIFAYKANLEKRAEDRPELARAYQNQAVPMSADARNTLAGELAKTGIFDLKSELEAIDRALASHEAETKKAAKAKWRRVWSMFAMPPAF